MNNIYVLLDKMRSSIISMDLSYSQTLELLDQILEIEKALDSEEKPQGEWIPISKGLPNLWEVVLVTDESNKVYEYERRPLDENGNECGEWAFLGRKIIAWQPLPEPYKEN